MDHYFHDFHPCDAHQQYLTHHKLRIVFYGKKNDNFEENTNFKEKIIENLDKLNDKELKYFYHWTSSEIAKKDL